LCNFFWTTLCYFSSFSLTCTSSAAARLNAGLCTRSRRAVDVAISNTANVSLYLITCTYPTRPQLQQFDSISCSDRRTSSVISVSFAAIVLSRGIRSVVSVQDATVLKNGVGFSSRSTVLMRSSHLPT